MPEIGRMNAVRWQQEQIGRRSTPLFRCRLPSLVPGRRTRGSTPSDQGTQCDRILELPAPVPPVTGKEGAADERR